MWLPLANIVDIMRYLSMKYPLQIGGSILKLYLKRGIVGMAELVSDQPPFSRLNAVSQSVKMYIILFAKIWVLWYGIDDKAS